jgi:hypothetical protein
MRFLRLSRRVLLALALAAVACLAAPGVSAPAKAPAKRVTVGPNVFLEIEGKQRRVIVSSIVVLPEGQLEGLLTRTMAKEHEYILASDSDARHIHLALTTAGAKHGSPVVLGPKYVPASGTPIKVLLRYKKDGKTVTVPASDWVREAKSKKALDKNWVFAGSRFVPNDDPTKPPIYLANHGDLICLCNIETAMLDLPIKSPKKFDSRMYEANTDRIPAKGTAVEVILEPVLGKGGR